MPGSMSGATRNLLLTVALGAVCSVGPVQAAEQQRLSREAYAAAKDTIAERHDKALAHCKTVPSDGTAVALAGGVVTRASISPPSWLGCRA